MTSLFIKALAGCCLGWACSAAHAAPFTPHSDAEIVQSLPGRLDAMARAQRAALARAPRQLPLALATARAAIERGRRHGDPRELGLAQAALAPWWALADPPPAVRLLRATVRQRQHDFAAALVDLDLLAGADSSTGSDTSKPTDGRTAQPPSDIRPTTSSTTTSASHTPPRLADIPLAVQAQAGLTRAAVLQVTGRLDEARQACQSLIADRFAALSAVLDLPAHACLAELRSLQGAPQPAALELAALARRSPGDRWLALVRAELAERMGDNRTAEAQFRSALAGASPGIASRGARRSVDSRDLGGSGRTAGRSGGGSSNASNDDATADVYTVAAYTDWLLSQGRNAEALASLERADPQADALLLRRAIALHRLGDAGSEASALEIGARLGARFDAARLRAENFHQREQARLALDLYGRADQALALALDNWTRQKEPADAVLLLRAAMAAGQPGAADPVQRLLAQGHADARLLRARQAAGSDVAQATVHRMQPVRGSPAAVTLVRTSVDQQTSQARP